MDAELSKVLYRLGWMTVLKQLWEDAPSSFVKGQLEHALQGVENLMDSLTGR